MDWLTGAIWLPLLGAALHPLLGWCVQQSTREGAGQTLVVCFANLMTVGIFLVFLRPTGAWELSGKDWWAIGNGLTFFLGQWFSIQSVKNGDIAVHSSALGVKVMIVACFSLGTTPK